jgi:hypothetical protein
MATTASRAKKERAADDPFFGYLLSENTQLLEAVGIKPKSEAVDLTEGWGSTKVYFPQSNGAAYSANAMVYYPQSISGFTMLDQLTSIESGAAVGAADLRRRVASFSKLEANWDDEGARPVSQETIRHALQIVEHVAVVLERKNTASSPSVSAFPDGSIFFKWVHGPKELNITVDGRNVAAQHWQPLDSYRSLGMWPISVDDTSEHVEWVLT